MIKIRQQNNYLVALESVAMTDIVMNMFIFFFISFSILYTFNPARVSKVDVRLPKASSAVSLEGSEKTILAITKDGGYLINDEKKDAGSLKEYLAARVKDDPSMSLLLKVDSRTKFSNVVNVLDIINELHIERVSVAAIKKQ
ncbi:MAG: biopolymer transporter ExbD [Candidatus Omnitrophota bacterium]|nr:biopolymer transporter ExbD [Candidatus Omnitrophota bacterium]